MNKSVGALLIIALGVLGVTADPGAAARAGETTVPANALGVVAAGSGSHARGIAVSADPGG